ncbi:hypothetical protein pdam_00007029 [Pocillopora damicornis]|uniref:Uncharacterized protein n=1 Tax=Pocillopora damicornis TaxID=46731 RepID=A0A3M6T992_POCDA|nr:hypothetical protein pdam_00007029 [Pocillopora damicornis]
MLFDTGLADSLVHQRVLDRSPKSFKLSFVGDPVVLANGQPLDIMGKCDLLICNDRGCLLGKDFLGKHGCKIDFEAKNICKVNRRLLLFLDGVKWFVRKKVSLTQTSATTSSVQHPPLRRSQRCPANLTLTPWI